MEKKNKQSLFAAPNGKSYLVPFILITSLFLLWGFAHGLLDVLNKHFQGAFTMTKAESGLVPVFHLYRLFPDGVACRNVYENVTVIRKVLFWDCYFLLPGLSLLSLLPFYILRLLFWSLYLSLPAGCVFLRRQPILIRLFWDRRSRVRSV